MSVVLQHTADRGGGGLCNHTGTFNELYLFCFIPLRLLLTSAHTLMEREGRFRGANYPSPQRTVSPLKEKRFPLVSPHILLC